MAGTKQEDWVLAEREDLTPGREVLIFNEAGDFDTGTVINFTPSGKAVMVKFGYSVRSVDPSELMVFEDARPGLLKEIQDMSMGDALMTPTPNDPEMQRINMYRSRIARDQAELSKLVLRYTKRQQADQKKQQAERARQKPGTYTPAQMQAMQQQSAANARANAAQQQANQGQGFPTLQQTTR